MATAGTWEELQPKLSPPVLSAIKELGFERMTPVQEYVIPLFMNRKDVCCKAETGSGKTLSFLVPIFEAIYSDEPERDKVLGLVVAPTVQLAEQIAGVAEVFARHAPSNFSGFKIVLAVGKKDTVEQNDQAVRHNSRAGSLLIGTPGRLLELIERLVRHDSTIMREMRLAALDEADRLLGADGRGSECEMACQTRKIVGYIPRSTHRGIFSATLNSDVSALSQIGQRNPFMVNMAVVLQSKSAAPDTMDIQWLRVDHQYRLTALLAVLAELAQRESGCKMMIFCLTCAYTNYLQMLLPPLLELYNAELERRGQPQIRPRLSAIHSGVNTQRRERIMRNFADPLEPGEFRIILCTDVLARGFDLPDVDFVLQLDAPQNRDDFLHRAGRTARIGRHGQALLFLASCEASFTDVLAEIGVHARERERPQCLTEEPLVGDQTAMATLRRIGPRIADAKHELKRRQRILERKNDEYEAIVAKSAKKQSFGAVSGGVNTARAAVAKQERAVKELEDREAEARESLLSVFDAPVTRFARQCCAANHALLDRSQEAFKSWASAYTMYQMKSIFRLEYLDLGLVAVGLGLIVLPPYQNMIELQRMHLTFKRDRSIDIDTIPYPNQQQEQKRLAQLEQARERRAEREAAPQPEPRRQKPAKKKPTHSGDARGPTEEYDWRQELEELNRELKEIKRQKRR